MALKVGEEPVPGYRLVKFLGRGGFGQVWQAASPGGIHVALKIIDLSGREGLKEFKALRLMKSIRQANLTPILAFWLKDEDGYLVDESQFDGDLAQPQAPASPTQGTVLLGSLSKMRPSELIIAMGLGDKTLSDRLRECQQQGLESIPPEELFNYMLDAARAIDFLNTPRHDLGHGPVSPIQHCDIKPQNILIVGDTAQVCDFGLARELGANVKMTSAAVSPAYGAPELIEGQPPSGATDQYSLAITYVELRTGSLPFSDPDSYLHVVNAHLQSALDLSYLSPEEQEIVRKATHRDPNQRFESALKMIKSLRQACPEEFGSRRAMPPRDRRGGALTGSDMENTAAFPGLPATYTDPADRRRTGTGPIPTTETPSLRALVTKVDPLKVTTGPSLLTDNAAGARRATFAGRMVKTTLAVGLVAMLGLAIWRLIPQDPQWRALYDARGFIDDAGDTTSLVEKGNLLAQAIETCTPFLDSGDGTQTRETIERAEKIATKEAAKRLKEIEEVSNRESRREPLSQLVAFGKRFKQVLPESSELAGIRRTAESASNVVETEMRDKIVADAESALEGPSTRFGADFFQRLDLAQTLASQSETKAEFGFRARLAAARAKARQEQLPPLGDLENLFRQWNELRSTVAGTSRWGAQLAVLRALDAKSTGPRHPTPALDCLTVVDKIRDELKKEGGWENDRFADVLRWADENTTPQNATEIKTRLKVLKSADLNELLKVADQQWHDGELDLLQATLDEADSTAPPFRELALLVTLKRNVTQEPIKAEQVDPALTEYQKLLDDGTVRKPSDLGDLLVQLASAEPKWLERSVGLVARARDVAQGGDQKARIGELLKGVYSKRLEQLVFHPLNTDAPYFQKLSEECDRAPSIDPENRLAKFALVESAASSSSNDESKSIGALPRGETAGDGDHQLYEQYVQLLHLDRTKGLRQLSEPGKWAEEIAARLDRLADASKNAGAPFVAEAKERRETLSGLLRSSERQLRTTAKGEPTVTAVLHPYGGNVKSAAQHAYNWTAAAIQVLPAEERTPELFASYAVSAWHSGTGRKNAAAAVKKYASNWDNLPDDLKWPVTFIKAMTLPAESNAEAARIGKNLIENVLKVGEKPIGQQCVDLHNELIEPSIARAKKVIDQDAKERKPLASLWFYKARVIRHDPDAPWGFADQMSRARVAIETALQYDPGNPEYLVERGHVLVSLNELNGAEADAREALRKNPKFFDAHALEGSVLLQKARRERDRGRVADLLRKSVEANKTAVEQARNDSDRFVCLLDLGTSYTELANYIDPQESSPKKLLELAIESVEKARKIDGTSWSDYAYTRLGNAYEDLAWRVKLDPDKNYDRAIEEFTNAKSQRPDLPGPLRDLGRCYFKREAESGQANRGYLKIALTNLTEAVALGKQNASAHYWLGRVYAYQARLAANNKNYEEATENARNAEVYFKKAKDLSEAGTPEWASFTFALVGAHLDDATVSKNNIRDQVDKLLNSKDIQADRTYTNQLYLLKAKAFERDGDAFDRQAQGFTDQTKKLAATAQRNKAWKFAIDVYDVALGPDLKAVDYLNVDLLKGRAQLRLDMAKGSSSERALCEAAVKDAKRIVELMGDNATAESYYLGYKAYQDLATAPAPAGSPPVTNADIVDSLKSAVEYCHQWREKTPNEQRDLEMHQRLALAIRYLLIKEPALVGTWKTTALEAIGTALQLQAPPAKKAELQELRRQINALK